jgi:hypothetical protein
MIGSRDVAVVNVLIVMTYTYVDHANTIGTYT